MLLDIHWVVCGRRIWPNPRNYVSPTWFEMKGHWLVQRQTLRRPGIFSDLSVEKLRAKSSSARHRLKMWTCMLPKRGRRDQAGDAIQRSKKLVDLRRHWMFMSPEQCTRCQACSPIINDRRASCCQLKKALRRILSRRGN